MSSPYPHVEESVPLAPYRDAGSDRGSDLEFDVVRRPKKKNPAWRLGRWAAIVLTISVLLNVICLILLSFIALGSKTLDKTESVSHRVQVFPAPILGADESEITHYYPAQGDFFLPQVPFYNQPPKEHPRTPLFIPFTRNSAMLRQTVLGYIAAGWPRQDIVIIDNSGTMDANSRQALSPDNPFYLPYDLFRFRYGVSILQTPTLLNFAQLQNFMLRIAMSRHWKYYFWSHMDVGILSMEDIQPYKPFFRRVLEILSESGILTPAEDLKWGVKFFNFDYLTLVNVAAWYKTGQWDVFIPYYATDCDAYGRLQMSGFSKDDVKAGYIWDIAATIDDPETKFFPGESELRELENIDGGADNLNKFLNTERYRSLKHEFDTLQQQKLSNSAGRNTWQTAQKGGAGQMWTYDPSGFQTAWWEAAAFGRHVFELKWKTSDCNLLGAHKQLNDLWASEH